MGPWSLVLGVPCLDHPKNLCSRGHGDEEIGLLKEVFIANGYPRRKVTELMNKRPRMKVKTEEEEPEGKGKEKLLLVFPYILYTGPE